MQQTPDQKVADFALARIEAQDAVYVQPLREFLERHGCRVIVNNEPDQPPLYTIAVGDSSFVKSFFERRKEESQKKLALVYGADDDGLNALTDYGVKLYLTDPAMLTPGRTTDIFAFFFTGTAKRKDDRKDPVRKKANSVIPREPLRETSRDAQEQILSDAGRVAVTMRQVFGPASEKKSRKPMTTYRRRITGVVLVILGIFILPTIAYFISLAVGVGLLSGSGKMLMDGNLNMAATLRNVSTPYIAGAQTLLRTFSPVSQVMGLGGFAEDQDRLLSVLLDTSKAESGVIAIFSKSKSVATAIFLPSEKQSTASVADVVALNDDVTRVSQHLALIQAELDSLLASRRFPFSSGWVQRLGQRGVSSLSKMRTLIDYTERLLALYPEMGGFRRKQTYLVLLQNSMELRPTGGFIGSLLLLTFSDGKVEDMRVLDVYTADGQLKGHIDPPLAIREIMGQEHWYLRDSNWDPDFSVSGKEAAWLYEKEMGDHVDGVIAVSVPLVTNLLRVTGPVDVPDFNERISESNFFAKSLLYTQTDFFPGSTQKKDFLGALTNALLLRITGDRSVSAGKLLKSITDSLESRDIQFYFENRQLESLVSQWGWSGAMDVAPCKPMTEGQYCAGDGLAVVEANLGLNKVNYFVTREALSDITIGADGAVRQIFTLKIHNGTPVNVPEGGGPYTVYARMYYPKDTSLVSVRLDGQEVPRRDTKSQTPPPAPYLLEEASGSAAVYGLPFSTNPHEDRQLIVETSRPPGTVRSNSVYQFTIRKQSGVPSFPWHVVVHYPISWDAIIEGGIAKEGELEYNTTLTRDASVRAIFQKTP